MIVIQLAQILTAGSIEIATRPRPFGVALRAGWGGWALPSEQMLATTGTAPAGALHARARRSVAQPREVGPRRPRRARRPGPHAPRCRRAHGHRRGRRHRRGVPGRRLPGLRRRTSTSRSPTGGDGRRTSTSAEPGARPSATRSNEQLGLRVTEIRPVGLSGSAGSTPLRLRVDGTPPYHLFGKLYSRTHLRSDRWYKLGRELLYGRLEDEKPFNAVRRLVQQEDYALRVVRDAGVPGATPYGFVELTPEREYMLVTEFFDGAVELSEAEVDDALIDDGLRVDPAPVGRRRRPPRHQARQPDGARRQDPRSSTSPSPSCVPRHGDKPSTSPT